MNQLTAMPKNGRSEERTSSHWWQASVQDFFSSINWEMHPVEVQEFKQAQLQGSTKPLSLTLSVAQFFSCMAWDGQPVVAPDFADSQNLEIPREETDDLTLDDFSDLF